MMQRKNRFQDLFLDLKYTLSDMILLLRRMIYGGIRNK